MTLPRLILFLLLVLSLAAMGAAWVISMPRPAFADNSNAVLNEPGDPSRGRDIFNAADCSSCHASPGQPDRLRLGGGLALASPMGTFHVPNISPDRVDGIGAWQTVDLANAIMSGVSPDRRHYYPVLPYTSYVRMRPEDVRDLMAYLRTLPPVQGKAPPHELPFPLNIRRTIGFWKLLFFDRSAMSRMQRTMLPGIAGATWSRQWAIAWSAIRLTIFWAPWRKKRVLRAGLISAGWVSCPTSLRGASAAGHSRT
jgi:mono/diheme cytochrome c family protein